MSHIRRYSWGSWICSASAGAQHTLRGWEGGGSYRDDVLADGRDRAAGGFARGAVAFAADGEAVALGGCGAVEVADLVQEGGLAGAVEAEEEDGVFGEGRGLEVEGLEEVVHCGGWDVDGLGL